MGRIGRFRDTIERITLYCTCAWLDKLWTRKKYSGVIVRAYPGTRPGRFPSMTRNQDPRWMQFKWETKPTFEECRREKCLPLSGIENRILGCPALSLVTIMTGLSQLFCSWHSPKSEKKWTILSQYTANIATLMWCVSFYWNSGLKIRWYFRLCNSDYLVTLGNLYFSVLQLILTRIFSLD